LAIEDSVSLARACARALWYPSILRLDDPASMCNIIFWSDKRDDVISRNWRFLLCASTRTSWRTTRRAVYSREKAEATGPSYRKLKGNWEPLRKCARRAWRKTERPRRR
jgi:hypothetical protein